MLKFVVIFQALLCFNSLGAEKVLRMQATAPLTEAYDRPSFSGKVVMKLPGQPIIEVNPKKIVGPDGIGVFYEYKLPNGRLVYINDSNLEPAPVVATATPGPVVVAPSPKPVIAAAPPKAAPRPEPIRAAPVVMESAKVKPKALPSYLGFNLGVLNYAEKYQENRYQANRGLIGLRLTSFFGNSRNFGYESNLMFSPGAPKFLYEAGASGASGGYVAIADYKLLASANLSQNFALKAGLGAAVFKSQFQTIMINEPYASNSTRAGVSVNAGLSYLSPSWGMILDLQQFVEKESYTGSQISFLFPY